MLKEFKEFAFKGSLIDTAIAFVMGAAFGKVTDMFVNGIFMPFISLIFDTDMSAMKYVLRDGVNGADGKVKIAEIAVKYGDFISAVIYFIVVAFVMFMLIKSINASKKKEAAAPPPPPSADVVLLTEIRDLLKR